MRAGDSLPRCGKHEDREKSMKIVNNRLEWEYHELAFSRRTSGFPIMVYNAHGNKLLTFPAEKRAGWITLPIGSRYLFRRYRTNSGYPAHELYEIISPDETGEGKLKLIAEITRFTTPSSIMRLNIPPKLKEELLQSL
jgi:hypothetical protein